MVAAFSTGPVGLGDGPGYTNPTLALATCRADGTLLQPDKPLTALDETFWWGAAEGAAPEGRRLLGSHATLSGRTWLYILAVDLPQGAQPSDAETTLAVAFSRMPEVIGVLEGQGAGLQPDRATADQVTAILGQGGYGLVTQDKGLNTMPKLAVKEGVPAAPVFRDFDSKGQTPTVIRRFLDQAAFKAGIEGSVIMMGRMRPETISALLVWGLQDRASQVALAPVSAVLKNATPE